MKATRRNPIAIGTHLVTDRGAYDHHGIYIGRGKVIHYAGLSDGLRSGPVEKVSLEKFADGQLFWAQPYENPTHTGQEVVRNALSRLGEDEYDLQTNNCEHFCVWAVTGVPASAQVDRVVKMTKYIPGVLGNALGVIIAIREVSGKNRNKRLGLDRAKPKPLVEETSWPFPTGTK